MIDIETIKRTYPNMAYLSDEQITNLRDALYVLVENIIDEYISSCDKM